MSNNQCQSILATYFVFLLSSLVLSSNLTPLTSMKVENFTLPQATSSSIYWLENAGLVYIVGGDSGKQTNDGNIQYVNLETGKNGAAGSLIEPIQTIPSQNMVQIGKMVYFIPYDRHLAKYIFEDLTKHNMLISKYILSYFSSNSDIDVIQ